MMELPVSTTYTEMAVCSNRLFGIGSMKTLDMCHSLEPALVTRCRIVCSIKVPTRAACRVARRPRPGPDQQRDQAARALPIYQLTTRSAQGSIRTCSRAVASHLALNRAKSPPPERAHTHCSPPSSEDAEAPEPRIALAVRRPVDAADDFLATQHDGPVVLAGAGNARAAEGEGPVVDMRKTNAGAVITGQCRIPTSSPAAAITAPTIADSPGAFWPTTRCSLAAAALPDIFQQASR